MEENIKEKNKIITENNLNIPSNKNVEKNKNIQINNSHLSYSIDKIEITLTNNLP